MKPFFVFLLVGWLGLNAARADVAPFANEVRFEQRIGETLPLATEVIDVDGARHSLGTYFRGRPVVLYFGYANCPQLCAVVADGTVAALRQIRRSVGRDVDVIAISIDPSETAVAAQARVNDAVHRYGDPKAIAGWNYLRGSESSIRAIADAAGFHFVHDVRSGQYAHPSGFVVITPRGVISRYFMGVDFDATTVAKAVDRAAAGKTGEPVLALLLECFRGDGFSGRYSGAIWRVLALAVTATVAGLAGGVAWMLRREFRQRRAWEGHS